MRLQEFAGAETDTARLAALAQFLAGRAQDSGSSKSISIPAFLSLAQDMGISMTDSQLRTLVQQPPLDSIIDNVEGDETTGRVLFRGSGEIGAGTEKMSPDQARRTVDSMAKRAAKDI